MIVSVHIPKTAGTSFRYDLANVFGPRVLDDYGDWPEITTPEGEIRKQRRRTEMLADVEGIMERYDVIHGHFVARKYEGAFPATAFVSMVRDPYQHAVSTFEHASRETDSPHPGFRAFKEARMTLIDFIETFPNHQALYFDGMSLDDFALIGLSERYAHSVALFEAIFGITMPRVRERQNVNPTKHKAEYDITPEVRRAVERSRAEDIELYRRACERFPSLCSRYGV
jgi:hypothetical protein